MHSSDLPYVLCMNDTVMKSTGVPQKPSGLALENSHPFLRDDQWPILGWGFLHYEPLQNSKAILPVGTTIISILQMGTLRLRKSKVICPRSQRERIRRNESEPDHPRQGLASLAVVWWGHETFSSQSSGSQSSGWHPVPLEPTHQMSSYRLWICLYHIDHSHIHM